MENPFFTRETRQLARRPLPLYGSLLLLAGAMGCCLGPLLWWKNDLPEVARQMLVVLLIGAHGLFSLGLGGYVADRVFADEHRRTTLEALRLPPIPPLRWLLLKLVFPLYLIGVAWLAALPLYLCAAVLNLAPLELLLQAWRVCLPLGLAMLPLVLLMPPDVQERRRRARLTAGAHLRHVDRDLLVRAALIASLILAVQALLIFRFGWGARRGIPFYTGYVPLWAFVMPVAAAFLAASFFTALATVSGKEQPERRAALARVAALVCIHYLNLGVLWTPLPPWLRAVFLLLIPAAALFLRRQPARPPEDRLASAETAWLARRWDNPLFVRDFRVYTRVFSIRRTILANVLLLVALAGGAFYLAVHVGGISIQNLIDGGSMLISFVIPMVLLADLSMRPFMSWTRERTGNTLPLLFLTPLRSVEILRGRLLAVVCYSCSANLPLVLAAAAALAWVILRFEVTGPAILGAAPVAACAAIAFAGAVRTSSLPPWKWTREEWLEAGLGMVMLAGMLGCFAIAVHGAIAASPPPSSWLYGLGLFLVNAAVAWAVFLLRVRLLDALRRGDAEPLG